ncbi:hypothetical protein BKA81DRAFT_21823 [Phyllosticta paracitricarpa]
MKHTKSVSLPLSWRSCNVPQAIRPVHLNLRLGAVYLPSVRLPEISTEEATDAKAEIVYCATARLAGRRMKQSLSQQCGRNLHLGRDGPWCLSAASGPFGSCAGYNNCQWELIAMAWLKQDYTGGTDRRACGDSLCPHPLLHICNEQLNFVASS